MTTNKKNPLHKNPAWVSYITPFKLIVPDDESPLEVPLDEINSNSYDHGQLCRIIGLLPTLNLPEFKLVVCYDGALAIPRAGRYKTAENAVDLFNDLFCQLLLGGVFCEAVDKRDIAWGQLYSKKLLWPVDLGGSVSTHLHAKLRTKVAGSLDSIVLSKPSSIKYSEFIQAMNAGKSIIKKISNLTPTYLIRGVTEIKYRNWDLALSSLWITIEQLTQFLWKEIFLKDKALQPKDPIPSRLNSLREDHRTWSISVKQEILFQANIINEDLFKKLYLTRQARNSLVHNGDNVEQNIAVSVYEAVTELILLCSKNEQLPMKNIDLLYKSLRESPILEYEFDDWIEISKDAA